MTESSHAAAPPVITLLSDLGHGDEMVGVMHSVLAQLAPHTRVVDLTHDIEARDVRGAALRLARSVQWLAPGVVVALVSPETATAGRLVAIELTGGLAHFIGPDNGLLAPAMAMVGGAERAVILDDDSHHLESPGRVHPGRDVLVPVAAALANGTPLEELGTPVDPAGLMPGLLPLPREEAGSLGAEVLSVDRFGDVQLNLQAEELAPLGDRLTLTVGDASRTAVAVDRRADAGRGLGWWTDTLGMVAVIADGAPAADDLGVMAGDEVVVSAAGADDAVPEGERSTPVALGATARGQGQGS
ncbi:MAG: SAM-dependent chlorinase/fluorinase [Microthrixaceae bacterium]